jgi:hypothetical protein
MRVEAGWVHADADHDTAAFAVESVSRWWDGVGWAAYPGACRLLITAELLRMPALFEISRSVFCQMTGLAIVAQPLAQP